MCKMIHASNVSVVYATTRNLLFFVVIFVVWIYSQSALICIICFAVSILHQLMIINLDTTLKLEIKPLCICFSFFSTIFWMNFFRKYLTNNDYTGNEARFKILYLLFFFFQENNLFGNNMEVVTPSMKWYIYENI